MGNISSLINGFKVYLQEISAISEDDYETSNSDISIFSYENEFKNYLSDEFDIDPNILSMDINDILNMDFSNDAFDNTNITEDNTTPQDQQSKLFISDFLNTIIEDESIKNLIDIDKNNELSEDEINSFLNIIKNYDGNEGDISLDDIIGALQDINNGNFTIKEDNQSDNETNINEQTETIPTSNTNQPTYSNNVGPKTLENMNAAELNSELESAKSDLANKKGIVSQILDGTYPELQALQENIDRAYELYQSELKKLDEDLAKQLDDIESDIAKKEEEINKKEQEIYNQEGVVKDAEKSYKDAVSTRKSLEQSLSSLESTDTSNMTSEQKAQLNSKISSLRAQVAEAKNKENNAKTTLEEEKDKLKTLEEEKEELISGDNGLNELKEQKSEIEENIAETYPQVVEYMDAYNEAKETYNNVKESALSSAKTAVIEAENYLAEVQTTIDNYDGSNEIQRINTTTPSQNVTSNNLYNQSSRNVSTPRDVKTIFNEKILDLAYSFLNYSELDMESECGISLPDGLWCAAFVQYIMEQSGNDIPDWYQNIANKHWCPNIYTAAAEAGAIVSADEAKPGDIVLFYVNDEDGSRYAHIGFVTSCENGILTTIEGNSYGDANNSSRHVAERTYDLNNNNSWVDAFTFVSV